jgi:poly-gamma-glutamate capsule biosynthesis protein CapA/YwtB (metallophosphatase superfamily)
MPASSDSPVRIMLVGDLILDEPQPDFFFEPSSAVLRSADAVVGHVEVPHSRRGFVASSDVPARPADPGHLEALPRAGFTVATLAGNHIADAGPEALADTVATLHGLGLATTGAGNHLAAARQPAVVEARGVRIGVLSYKCVGPREAWARPSKAGCAYGLRAELHWTDDRVQIRVPECTALPGGRS